MDGGVGLITVDVERQSYRLSLIHVAEGGVASANAAHPLWAPARYGVAATPWRAVVLAGWEALNKENAA